MCSTGRGVSRSEPGAAQVLRLYLSCDVGLAGGRGILTKLSLCYSTVYHYKGAHCTVVRAVLTGRSTGSGFDLAWFSSLLHSLLCLLAWCDWFLDLVDYPLSFSAMTLLVGSSDL